LDWVILIYSIEQSDPADDVRRPPKKELAAAHYIMGGPQANTNNAFTLGPPTTRSMSCMVNRIGRLFRKTAGQGEGFESSTEADHRQDELPWRRIATTSRGRFTAEEGD